MKNVLFWGVVPFLLPQALYVRKTAPRFAPAAGPSEGMWGNGTRTRLLAVGDSIIAGVGASELSKALVGQTAAAIAASLNCCVSWQAHGISGYNSTKILDHLLPALPDVTADYIIVSVGVNDITGLTTLRKWRQNLSLLLDKLHAHSPDAVIAIAGMPPFPIPLNERQRWFNCTRGDHDDERRLSQRAVLAAVLGGEEVFQELQSLVDGRHVHLQTEGERLSDLVEQRLAFGG